ncbi:MAG TPA: hypothetical protein DCP55_04920, partial [Chitinophagaceae bacterium]|nr:hypothetical protein [Chitinophagaceae bacterium]
YALRCVSNGKYLDGRNHEAEVIMTGRNPNGDRPLNWAILSVDGGHYALRCVSNGKYLDGRNHEAEVIMTGRNPNGDRPLNWSFIPMNYRLSAVIEDFQYGPMVEDLNALARTTVSAVAWSAQNDSYDTPLTVHPAINQSKMNENSWAFTESHERNFFNRLEVGVSAKCCGVKGSVNNTTTWTQKDKTLEETKKHTIDQTEVSMVADITIAPRKKVAYSIAWREVDATIPFTATVKVKGLSDCMKTNGSIASMAQVDADGVLALLRHDGYQGEIIGRDGRFILARIHGNLKVNGAISGNLTMSTQDL